MGELPPVIPQETLKSLIYRSTGVLDCQCDSAVIICVSAELTASGKPYIDGALTSTALTGMLACSKQIYAYYLSYDSALLADPSYTLTASDITGILCRGCLTSYIDAQTAEPPTPICEGSSTVHGRLVVCDGDNQRILALGQEGQVPVVVDALNSTVEFRDIGTGGSSSDGWFGMGYDGDATIAIDAALTGDKGYRDCIINAGVTLLNSARINQTEAPAFRLYCSGTLEIHGTISADGQDAQNNFTSNAIAGTIGGGTEGKGRALGGTGVGGPGTIASPLTSSGDVGEKCGMGGVGGDGGSGGTGANAGGVGRVGGAITRYDIHHLTANFIVLSASFSKTDPVYVFGGTGGGGGGAGGGNGAFNGGGSGGGSGAGAGFLFIAARTIRLKATGKISAEGGDGQNGGNGTSTFGGGICGGGGGGGAGGGGVIYLIYENFIDEGGILSVAGGSKGAGGTGLNGGANGADGTDGNPGRIIRFNTTLNAFE